MTGGGAVGVGLGGGGYQEKTVEEGGSGETRNKVNDRDIA